MLTPQLASVLDTGARPTAAEMLAGQPTPAHQAGDHVIGNGNATPRGPLSPASHEGEPFREPTETGVRRQPATLSRYSGWPSAQ